MPAQTKPNQGGSGGIPGMTCEDDEGGGCEQASRCGHGIGCVCAWVKVRCAVWAVWVWAWATRRPDGAVAQLGKTRTLPPHIPRPPPPPHALRSAMYDATSHTHTHRTMRTRPPARTRTSPACGRCWRTCWRRPNSAAWRPRHRQAARRAVAWRAAVGAMWRRWRRAHASTWSAASR